MANIRCYHCKDTHESVAEVRACANVPAASATVPAFVGGDVRLASDKQIKFINDLLLRKVGTSEFGDFDATKLSRSYASHVIDRLLGMDDVAPGQVLTTTRFSDSQAPVDGMVADVPAGYYAIEADGTTKFYRVDRPTEGRWAGRTFVKVQASDEFYIVRGRAVEEILLTIAMDTKAAMALYGRRLGRCGVCNRTLTDETSRALGIGPVCREKF